jgi:hypothetical protein
MARERPDHTLQATALIDELYLRLVDSGRVTWQDRNHFFAVCARLMRRILTDFARSRHYKKRGVGALPRVPRLEQKISAGLGGVEGSRHTVSRSRNLGQLL